MTLGEYCKQEGMDPDRAMDVLQGEGLVSDNAIHVGDVAQVDADRAMAWLRANWPQCLQGEKEAGRA